MLCYHRSQCFVAGLFFFKSLLPEASVPFQYLLISLVILRDIIEEINAFVEDDAPLLQNS